MLFTYSIISIVFSLCIFFAKNNTLTKVLFGLFLLSQIALSFIAFFRLEEVDSLYFKFDALGVLLSFVLTILSVATFYHSTLYLKRHDFTKKQEAIYYSSLIMLIASMMNAYFAENIALLWVCIEATTLFITILIFHERTKEALEATWKYLFISSVGVAIAFMGILFLSMAANSTGITNLSYQNLLSVAHEMNTTWLKISFLLILAGYSVKLSLFPLYAAAIDAKTIAPSPINALMSTALVNVAFVAIFRTFVIISQTSIMPWAQNILIITGVVSVFIATIQLTRIQRLKRMYAFSSMKHVGIIAIGLAVGGIGYYAAILHLIFHSFVKASIYYQIGTIRQYFKTGWIKDTGNYFKLNPVGGLALILCEISVLSIPPSGLFVSEFLTFKAIIMSGHIYIAILLFLLITVIIYVFSKNSYHLLFGDAPTDIQYDKIKISPYEGISQFVLLFLVIYLGINPPLFFTDLIYSAIAILN